MSRIAGYRRVTWVIAEGDEAEVSVPTEQTAEHDYAGSGQSQADHHEASLGLEEISAYETMVRSKLKQRARPKQPNDIIDLKVTVGLQKTIKKPSGYTEKYIGVINGEFGILSNK